MDEAWSGITKTSKPNVNSFERLASLLGGGLLTFYGLRRRSPGGLGLALAGGYMVYRGLTGHCPLYQAFHIDTAHTHQLQFEELSQELPDTTIEPDDTVDEAVWQTFPASDPPASW